MDGPNSKLRIAIKNILFATDLSYAAEAAVPYALEIARLYGSKIYAVHVTIREGDKPQGAKFERLKNQLAGVPNEVVIEVGDVRTVLLSFVGRKEIDLIVVGTHGRTGLGRVLVGSVAEAIFREASCPVLTVGPRLAADPKWTLKIQQILYATDLTPTLAAAARYAVSLAQENQARLAILNVLPEPKAGELATPEDYSTSVMGRLHELVPPEAELWCQPHCMVERGDPAEKILDVAASYKADIIVLGIRPHSIAVATHLSRPTAHRVVAGATCPVLTVRG